MTLRRMYYASVALLSALLVTTQANGQTIPEAARKSMGKLVGVWKIELLVDGAVVKSEIDAKWNQDKTAVCYYGHGIDRQTKKPTTWTGIIGWDGEHKVLVEYSVASNGELFISTLETSDKDWRSPTKGTMLVDGQYKQFKRLRIFKWNSPDEIVILGQKNTIEGKPVPDHKVTLRRVK
jgi:hypothetical protein